MGIAVILSIVIIGACAGWLASMLVKGAGSGLGGNIVLGILGAIIANVVFPILGVRVGGGFIAVVIHATIGACLLLLAVRSWRRL